MSGVSAAPSLWEATRSRWRRLAGWTLLVVGLVAAGGSGFGWAHSQATQAAEDRATLVSSITASATAAFQRDLDFEAAFAARVEAEPDLTNARLAPWFRGLDLARRYPGTVGFAFVEPVPASQLGAFEATMRADPLVGQGPNDFSLLSSGVPQQYCLGRLGIALTASLPSGADFCTSQLPVLGSSPMPAAMNAARDTGKLQLVKIANADAATNLHKSGVPAATAKAIMELFIVVQPVYEREAQSGGRVGSGPFMGWMVGTFSATGLAGAPARSVRSADLSIGTMTAGRFDALGSAGPHLVGRTFATVRFTDTAPELAVRTTVPVDESAAVQGLTVGLFAALFVWLLSLWLFRLAQSRDRARAVADIAEHSLALSEERFKTLATSAPIGIVETSRSGEATYANPKAAEITGRPTTELLGEGWLTALDTADVGNVLGLLGRPPPRRGWVTTQCRLGRSDGESRQVRMLIAPKGDGPDEGRVITIEDTTEEVHAHEELRRQAFHDGLTGLPNRALFLDRLNQELGHLDRGSAGLAVLFMDLDGFKRVNDSLGHETGDVVLKVMGDRLARAVRAGETVARLGGDEFMFILRDVDGTKSASRVAQRILEVVASPVTIGSRELSLTGSIGIVMTKGGGSASELLRDADTAMYRAKQAGRNRYAVFDEAMHRRSVARLETETALRHALDRDELELYFQPIVEALSGRPVSAEALVRWHHPTRGLVPPDEFIPVAEAFGLIIPLSRWVLERAAGQLASWDARRGAPRLETLAVNLSAHQLEDSEAIQHLSDDLLTRFSISPDRLSLEVTESVIMSESAATKRSLTALQRQGLRVAIDDFGTGYSSLAYLHSLPVATIKIDRSFIERLGAVEDSTEVVRAIVEMGHALGLRVVAEGVSDERIASLVASLGCDRSQGFYFARPLPAVEFEAWWRRASGRPTGMAARRAG